MRHKPIATLVLALSALAAEAPPILRISGTRFHQGEPIPFTLDRPHTQAQFAGFLLEPPAGCGTVEQPCYDLQPHGGGRAYSPVIGGEINAYVPSFKPGRYRATGLFVVGSLKSTVTSTPAEFEIIAATPEWQRRTIAAAAKTLVEGDSYEPVQMREAAAHQLRYIQTPEAWEAELDQLDKSEHELLGALEFAADKKTVCSMMRTHLTHAQQYVGIGYFYVLHSVCGVPADDAAAELASHLSVKSAAMKDAAIEALVRYGSAATAKPVWLDLVRSQVVSRWPQFPEHRQKLFLEEPQWIVVHGPEMAAPLETLLDGRQVRDPELWRFAVLRLNEFAPAKAQALLVADMLQPATRTDETLLALLPPEATRNLTPRLIQVLAETQKGNGGDYRHVMALIARFGDTRSLPRIKSIFESQTDPCQPELLAYFLRVDPAYADAVLHRQPWDMHAPAPACAPCYFAVSARIYMSPELERFTAAYLMHGNVQVKMAAAESLGRYGTAAAEKPLWETFRYFHDYWKDQRALLTEHPEGEYLEVELRNAIARGAGWRATEADLRLIDTLCISERCRYETLNDLQHLREPLTVSVEGDRSRVAQYFNITSLDALEKKLAQFPSGTRFRLRVQSSHRDRIVERLKQFGARKGLAFQLTS